jgi:putative aminopeptidase FrvX
MKLDLGLLERLSEVAGIPGWEDRVRDLVTDTVAKLSSQSSKARNSGLSSGS